MDTVCENAPFLATGNTVLVWTLDLTREKRCVFNFIRLSRPRKESRNVSRSHLAILLCSGLIHYIDGLKFELTLTDK